MEWWMRRRQLPHHLRQRVRHYERQKWAAMRGVDEGGMINDLPEGLRRDVKYHLCLDLVRQVYIYIYIYNIYSALPLFNSTIYIVYISMLAIQQSKSEFASTFDQY